MGNRENMGQSDRETFILAVETSSRIGSVAIARGDALIEESVFSGPMQHSAEIFPAIADLLARHGRTPEDIDEVHIAIGPGSFTGLRIAVTLAKAMHLAQGVRIVTVDSLDVVATNLADGARDGTSRVDHGRPTALPDRIAALFDAKRGQFYASIYDRRAADADQTPPEDFPGYQIPGPGDAIWRKIHQDSLMTAREIIEGFAGASTLGVLGDGLLYHREQFTEDRVVVIPEESWSPHAANAHRLGRQKARAGLFADPLTLTPFYLRGPQVTLRRTP
jgi:tRNA threonylcarbamoyl adenosine modification protein YeaZ